MKRTDKTTFPCKHETDRIICFVLPIVDCFVIIEDIDERKGKIGGRGKLEFELVSRFPGGILFLLYYVLVDELF